jgi:hypothetical protein
MRHKVIRKVGKWCLWGAITCGLIYSMAVFTARRAFAASCTPSDCTAIEEGAETLCFSLGAGNVVSVTCPVPGEPDNYIVLCQHYEFNGSCSN